MPCPFYGHSAAQLIRTLMQTSGNRCALITEAHSPCRMEIAHQEPDLEKCEFNGSGRAIRLRYVHTRHDAGSQRQRRLPGLTRSNVRTW